MSFSKVVIEKMAYSLPPNIVRSEELEESLSPLYDRLNLNIGRLELMTGIKKEDSGKVSKKHLRHLRKRALNYLKKEISTQVVLIYYPFSSLPGPT